MKSEFDALTMKLQIELGELKALNLKTTKEDASNVNLISWLETYASVCYGCSGFTRSVCSIVIDS